MRAATIPTILLLLLPSTCVAQVRQGGGQQSPFLEQLTAAEEAAKQAGKGLWSKDPDAATASIRPQGGAVDAPELLAQHGKGKPLAAVVEQVGICSQTGGLGEGCTAICFAAP